MKTLLAIIVFCTLLLLPTNIFAQKAIPLNTDFGIKTNPSFKLDSKNKLHLVYEIEKKSLRSSTNFSAAIAYQQSLGNMKEFSKPVLISHSVSGSYEPDIAFDNNGTIYIVWSGITQNNRTIFLTKSIDNGLSFSTPITISQNNGQTPKIIVTPNNDIHVVYFETNTPTKLVISSSKDGANTFSYPKQISRSNRFAIPTTLLMDQENNLYIFYESSFSSFLVKSKDGLNFTAPITIVTGFNPQAAIDKQNNIFVVFCIGDEIRLTKSFDQGETFHKSVLISDTQAFFPALVIDKNNTINIAWQEGIETKRIFFSQSQDLGTSFAAKTRLSKNSNSSIGVVATTDSNKQALFSWLTHDPTNNTLFTITMER